MKGFWEWITMDDGTRYMMCSCGTFSPDGEFCLKGHKKGHIHDPKKRQAKHSGYSKHRAETGEFQVRRKRNKS